MSEDRGRHDRSLIVRDFYVFTKSSDPEKSTIQWILCVDFSCLALPHWLIPPDVFFAETCFLLGIPDFGRFRRIKKTAKQAIRVSSMVGRGGKWPKRKSPNLSAWKSSCYAAQLRSGLTLLFPILFVFVFFSAFVSIHIYHLCTFHRFFILSKYERTPFSKMHFIFSTILLSSYHSLVVALSLSPLFLGSMWVIRGKLSLRCV